MGDVATLFPSAAASAPVSVDDAFAPLVEPHRRELLVYCYRMLGSLLDAEDAVQETFLRAWRRLDTFEGRASFRAWLYRIACNTCLDALDTRRRKWGWGRTQPSSSAEPANPEVPAAPPLTESIWLEPCPDVLLDVPDDLLAGPEARYEAGESVSLAFVAVVQSLPPRQRAALLLRDVLGWSTAEAAETLDVTNATLNSLLQRARDTMRRRYPQRAAIDDLQLGATSDNLPLLPASERAARASDGMPRTSEGAARAVAARYAAAWAAADVDTLVSLLREDARMTMPPTPSWYDGRHAIGRFFATQIFAGPLDMRLLPAAANRQPAFAVYCRPRADATGPYRPLAIKVLTVRPDATIAEITGFTDPAVFPRFGLNPELAL